MKFFLSLGALVFISLNLVAQSTLNQNILLHGRIQQMRNGRIDVNRNSTRPEISISPQYLPGKEIISSWDTTNLVWVYNDSIAFSYNGSGKKTIETVYGQTGGALYKTTNSYNISNNLTQNLIQTWNGTMWVNNYHTTYSYNGFGQKIEAINQHWNTTLNNWENNERTSYSYNSLNLLSQDVYEPWDSGISNWINSSKDDYTYNPDSQLIEILAQVWNSGWEYLSKTTYGYNGAGEVDSSTVYTYNFTLLVWEPSYQNINYSWYHWIGSILNSNNKIAGYLQQQWILGNWENYLREAHSYDAFANDTNYLSESWNGGAWVTQYETRDTYTYDSNYNITQDIEEDWDVVTQQLKKAWKYDYSNYIVLTGLNEAKKNPLQILVYPNPFKTESTVLLNETVKEPSTFFIYNVMGQQVAAITFSGDMIHLKRNGLESGIYFFTIISGNKILGRGKISIG